MKISIITAVYNRASTILQSLNSVHHQSWSDLEHIVVDGASTDGTVSILQAFTSDKLRWVSEPDNGIYYAINKGLALATGDVIGLMHSDDFFADSSVLARVAAVFSDPDVDAVYGDLDYVSKSDSARVIRRWRAGYYNPANLAWGWMPPHPTLYLRKSIIDKWGGYDTDFSIAADYDAILRYFVKAGVRAVYIPHVLVKMRVGGVSNRSLSKILLKTREDYRALHNNRVGGIAALFWKNLSKIRQFF